MVWMDKAWQASTVPRIVIVGAGILGAALADQLAPRRSGDVVLIDRSLPGSGTSRASFAWFNANKKQPRAYFDFSVEAMREWGRLASEFGEPPWYQPAGNLAWARSPQMRKELVERVDRLRAWGYGAEVITASRARELEPNVTIPSDAQIAFFPDEGYVCGCQAAQALVQRASSLGATLVTDVEVRELVVSHNRVTGVHLADGERIAAQTSCAVQVGEALSYSHRWALIWPSQRLPPGRGHGALRSRSAGSHRGLIVSSTPLSLMSARKAKASFF
jgi:glycine/D-amino acid oxidase-like deaminating enzyme